MTEPLLHSGWTLNVRNPSASLTADFQTRDGWTPATIPGSVQWVLPKTRQIEDPFDGLKEKNLQWIGQEAWLYAGKFTAQDTDLQAEHLHFEGLEVQPAGVKA